MANKNVVSVRGKRKIVLAAGSESMGSKGKRGILFSGLVVVVAFFMVWAGAAIGSMISPPNQIVLQNQSIAQYVYTNNSSAIPFANVNGQIEYPMPTGQHVSYIETNATLAELNSRDAGKIAINLSQPGTSSSSSAPAVPFLASGGAAYPVSGIEHGIVPGTNLAVLAPPIINQLGGNGYDISGFTVGDGYLFVTALGNSGYTGSLLMYNMTSLQLVKSVIHNSSNALNIPYSPVYVSATHTLFYGDFGGAQVSWYNLSTGRQGNISVSQGSLGGGYGPISLVSYDNAILEVGGNVKTNNLTLINTTSLSVMQNLRMGQEPNAIVADPSAHLLFVANSASNSVTVINASSFNAASHNSLTILKNVTVGTGPWSEQYHGGSLYVANVGSGNISVMDASTLKVTSSIAISHMWTSSSCAFLTYTGGNLFAASSTTDNVSAINTTTLKFTANLTASISSNVLYGYGNYVYDGNYAGNNFFIIGHPTPWTMNLSQSGTSHLHSSNYVVDTMAGAGLYYANATSPGYFTDHLGILNVTKAMSVNVTFHNVNITETGLPAGTNWTIDWNGTLHRTNLSYMTLSEPNGTYMVNGSFINFSSPSGRMGFAPMMNSEVTISGRPVSLNVTYVPMYAVSFDEKGLPKNTEWNVSISIGYNASGHTGTGYMNMSSRLDFIVIPVFNGSVSFDDVLFNLTYTYTIGKVPGYVAVPRTGTFNVTGKGVTINVTFSPPTYVLTFTETGLPKNTSWSISLSGVVNNATTSAISFSEPNGTYDYSIGGVVGYTTSSAGGSVAVNGSSTQVSITFSPLVVTPTQITMGYGTSPANFVPLAFATVNGSTVSFTIQPQYLTGNQSKYLMIRISSSSTSIDLRATIYGNSGVSTYFGPITGEEIGYWLGAAMIFGGAFMAMPWHDIRFKRGGKR